MKKSRKSSVRRRRPSRPRFGEWVSLSKRKPPENDDVLFTLMFDREPLVMQGHREGRRVILADGTDNVLKAMRGWMPLPPPMK